MQNDIVNSDKLLFICASPAGMGYRFGRILSCIDNVFWYSNGRNGKYPWTVYKNDRVAGKQISQYHYDRYIGYQMVPLVGERIEAYWKSTDLDYFYNEVWAEQMLASGAISVIENNMFISWIVHDTPQYILKRFPNAKIINLVDDNINDIINRYIETTALFPIILRNKKLKPNDYYTEYAWDVEKLVSENENATHADLWALQNKNSYNYSDLYESSYKQYLTEKLNNLHNNKSKINSNYLNISWSSFDINLIKDYLNSNVIDKNYQLLIL